jgi:transposase-like protein
MASPQRTPEFRAEAVRIALTSGLSRKQVAADLGVGVFNAEPLDTTRSAQP